MVSAVEIILSEFLVVAIFCTALIQYFQSKSVPIDVSIAVFVSWVLGFATVLILPYDLSNTIESGTSSFHLANMWKTIYWSTFLLAWIILPIQMEYHSSGHFTVKEKLLDALKKLGLAASVAIVGGIVYFVYMILWNHFSIDEAIAFTMAMSNTYGILLITFLMGSGLAGLPKRIWLMANAEDELKRLYIMATNVEDDVQDAKFALEDIEAEVFTVVEYFSNTKVLSSSLECLVPLVAILETKIKNSTRRPSTKRFDVGNISKNEIVNLHAKLIKNQEKSSGNQRRWNMMLDSIVRLQQGEEREIDDSNKSTLPSIKLSIFYSNTLRVVAFVCALCSCIILWCELLMASNLQSPLGWMMNAYNENEAQPILIQSVAFLALSYMSVCTYWTLFRMNIGWSYRLQGPQLSPFSSLIFNAEYLSRLQFALGYNFLLCLNISRSENTAFHSLMENMEVVPVFGTSFTIYVPIVMILIAIITFFDGFARILNLLGIESEESIIVHKFCGKQSSELESVLLEKYQHGQMLVNHELNVRRLHASTNQAMIRENDSSNTIHTTANYVYRLCFPASNPYTVLEKVNPLHANDDEDVANSTSVGLRKDMVVDPGYTKNEVYGNRLNNKATLHSSKSEHTDGKMSFFDIEEKDEERSFRGRYSD